MPVFNGEKYLAEAIKSAISQTYKSLDIVIIDDGSTDTTLEIIKKFIEIDSRIRFFRNASNLGLVGNWQRCIAESKGSWIKFLFQDDLLEETCVETMYLNCEENRVDVAVCSRNLQFEENCKKQTVDFLSNMPTLKSLLAKSQVITPVRMANFCKNNLFLNIIGEPVTFFFKKEILLKVGSFNCDLVQLVDYEFILRASLNLNIVFVAKDLATFRVHAEAASNNAIINPEKISKRHFQEPLILYHEYLFNSNFKLLRSSLCTLKLFWEAVRFYGGLNSLYLLTMTQKKVLFQKYKGMYLFASPAFIWKLKNVFKKNYQYK